MGKHTIINSSSEPIKAPSSLEDSIHAVLQDGRPIFGVVEVNDFPLSIEIHPTKTLGYVSIVLRVDGTQTQVMDTLADFKWITGFKARMESGFFGPKEQQTDGQ